MSDPIVDAFIDSFLEKVCASGDAVKVAFAVDRVIRGEGLKKEALAPMTSTYAQRPAAKPAVTPAPFTPPFPVPSPATAPAPLPALASPKSLTPPAPAPIFGPGWMGAPAAKPATPAPKPPIPTGPPLPAVDYGSAAGTEFNKNPVSTFLAARDHAVSLGMPKAEATAMLSRRLGRVPTPGDFSPDSGIGFDNLRADVGRYARLAAKNYAGVQSQQAADQAIWEKNRATQDSLAGDYQAAQARKGQEYQAAKDLEIRNSAVGTLSGAAGRAKELISSYPSVLAAQQKSKADASAKIQGTLAGFAGKAKQFAFNQGANKLLGGAAGAIKNTVTELPSMLARGQQTQANAAADVQAEAAKRKDLERQLSERETNYDRQDSVLRTSHDNQVDEGLAKLRAQLAGIDSGIESGPIPKFKNLPQLVAPSEGNTPEAQAKRQALVSQIAQLEGSRLRQKAPEVTDAAGMEAQKKMILDSIAARKAQRAPSAASTAAASKTQGEVEDRRSAENQIRSSNAQRKAYELAKEMSTAKPNPRMP